MASEGGTIDARLTASKDALLSFARVAFQRGARGCLRFCIPGLLTCMHGPCWHQGELAHHAGSSLCMISPLPHMHAQDGSRWAAAALLSNMATMAASWPHLCQRMQPMLMAWPTASYTLQAIVSAPSSITHRDSHAMRLPWLCTGRCLCCQAALSTALLPNHSTHVRRGTLQEHIGRGA